MYTDQFVAEVFPQLPITRKTLQNYRSAYRNHLSPALGSKQLAEITKKDLLETLSHLPPQTRYQSFMVARMIMREAQIRDLVTHSPFTELKSPKVTTRPQKFLTWQEISQINFGKHQTHIKFLALHGLRWGEAAALTYSDIYDGFIHINKSIHGATKTPSGIRKVPQISEFKNFPLCQKYIAQALRPYGVTVHSLRKTYAYNLKEAGVHVTTAAKLMGHSNPMVTLKIYTQVRDIEIAQSGEQISKYINQIQF